MRRLGPISARRLARPLVGLLPATLIIATGCGAGSDAVASASASSGDSRPTSALTVTPTLGRPSSVLHFRFRAGRLTSGQHAGRLISYELSIGGSLRRSCSSTRGLEVLVRQARSMVSVSVAPPSGGWCTGSYTAQVDEVARPVCGPGQLCPMFVAVLGRLGRAHFRIEA